MKGSIQPATNPTPSPTTKRLNVRECVTSLVRPRVNVHAGAKPPLKVIIKRPQCCLSKIQDGGPPV